jgi:hypothetical protein
MEENEYVITLTFGECAENHVGMQKLGKIKKKGEGVNLDDLKNTQNIFESKGFECELIDLVNMGEVEDVKPKPDPAYILIIRNAYEVFLKKDEYLENINKEQTTLVWDSKALMRGRVVNKIARTNLVFANESQEPEYEIGKGRVYDFSSLPILNRIRKMLPEYFGSKARDLFCEGNHYYDMSKCGIGLHGDSERRIVVALRVGNINMNLQYQWFQRSAPIGKRIEFDLQPGDMYVMSEKSVGTDWKSKIIPTLRHAAGAKKYLVAK